eukprot:gene5567-6255_t
MSKYHRPEPTSLFLRNLHRDTRPEELRKMFDRYGPVSDFDEYRDAEDALRDLDGVGLHGRELQVQFADGNRKTPGQMRTKEDRGSRRGFFGTGGYGPDAEEAIQGLDLAARFTEVVQEAQEEDMVDTKRIILVEDITDLGRTHDLHLVRHVPCQDLPQSAEASPEHQAIELTVAVLSMMMIDHQSKAEAHHHVMEVETKTMNTFSPRIFIKSLM